ncbi:Asp-tRNA(Asn)/Glu-tRNA(Gln) amidotransferase subunit GatC [[Mycoplasma] collis]|uniref:Asp-tRNA(Asn)/Glu-tRNA(Gln) amidotransferase subunit GatC n=1 Tax=[Mycoplasma] collis TaxID=2127 RepID=UPI00051BEB5E|nr:Asp-tRNA(Asn)/Glu-tRNA(Gln) amidotransferase subunit GatC [[Mycoplasma] collis]
MKYNDKKQWLNEEKITNLAKKIMLKPSKEAIELLKNDYNQLIDLLSLVEEIDVTNVMPLTRIENLEDLNLREDIPKNYKENKSKILKNAAEKNSDFIIVKKVIKNDN